MSDGTHNGDGLPTPERWVQWVAGAPFFGEVAMAITERTAIERRAVSYAQSGLERPDDSTLLAEFMSLFDAVSCCDPMMRRIVKESK